ncbi:MAG: L,D-transpeptidase family protein [Candidatus Yonathbacteria bacterium]|nr:L,D-transpeptidase family protein [Candidatus Yonathbacteria bacterium]
MFAVFNDQRLVTRILSWALSAAFLVIVVLFLKGRQQTPSYVKYVDDPSSVYLEASVTPFPRDEEVVIVEPKKEGDIEEILPVKKVLFEYIEVTDGCGLHFEGECLLVRSGPGSDYPVVSRLRSGIVLKISGKVEREGRVWYKIVFDEWVRYPERITGDWYVAADYVRILLDEGILTSDTVDKTIPPPDKRIIVNRTTQTLSAYEGDTLFMEEKISTGLELTPTPAGTFSIFRKTPSRYMQGPIPNVSDQYYDLPGVPWNLYFTHGGAVIHGAYWHDSFGVRYSHGCVNLPLDKARVLYAWADLGTRVTVSD